MQSIPYLKFASLHTGVLEEQEAARKARANKPIVDVHIDSKSRNDTLSTILLSRLFNTTKKEILKEKDHVLPKLKESFLKMCKTCSIEDVNTLFELKGYQLFGENSCDQYEKDSKLPPKKIDFHTAKRTFNVLLNSISSVRRTCPGIKAFHDIDAFIIQVEIRAEKYLNPVDSVTVIETLDSTRTLAENCQSLVESRIGCKLDECEKQALFLAMQTVVAPERLHQPLLVAVLDQAASRSLYLLIKSLDTEMKTKEPPTLGSVADRFIEYATGYCFIQ